MQETLAGQANTAVGRTSQVSGSVTATGSSVTSASFAVQLGSVTSDRSQRDQQFDGRIMDVSQYPTGTFVLSRPIPLPSAPALGSGFTATATGNLTLHGTTQQVSFPVSADWTGATLQVTGSFPIAYAAYGIPNPSFGGFVSVGSSGTIEFLLVLTKG